MPQIRGERGVIMYSAVAKQTFFIGLLLLSLFALGLLPVFLQAKGNALHLDWSTSWDVFSEYIRGVFDGSSFHFFTGKTEHLFFEQIGAYFRFSLFYVATAAIIGITLGIVSGMWLANKEWLKAVFEFFVLLPDFVIIVLLQLFVVYFMDKTGILLAQVATFTSDRPALLLPFISMSIIPSLFVMRTVSLHCTEVSSAEYIMLAKAKGFSRTYIRIHHVLPNVLPYLRADLHKLLGTIMGNLFIVEYIFNLQGVTKLMLSSALVDFPLREGPMGNYQYSIVINSLLSLMLIYFIVYLIIRGYLRWIEKGAKRS